MNRKSMFIALAFGLGMTVVLMWLSGFSEAGLVPARAASYTVCPAGPPTCDYSVIQDAVDAAGDGDEIKVATGTYADINDHDGLLQVVYIDKSITIRGGYTTAFTEPPDSEANPTTLDAGRQGRVLYITGNINPMISGLRITGGDATIHGDWESGGGVFIANSTAIIDDNDVFNNTADGGGGIWLDNSDATLSNNSIISNTATDGGGIYMWESDNATLIDNNISHNTAVSYTGGLRSLDGDNITLTGNTISYNSGDWSGGLDLRGNGIKLIGNTIISNTATDHGGGLSLSGDIKLIGNIISYNTGVAGGGGMVLWGGSPTLINNIIANNQSELGGGIQVFWSNPTFFGNTFSENSAMFGGGMSLGDNNATIYYNTFISNTATHQGGGLYIQGEHLLTGNTFSANSAHEGGGLFLHESDATLTNNIVFSNQADFGSGLAIGASSPSLVHNTIARNTGGSGRGIYLSSGTVALTNTILVSHTVGIYVEPGSTASLEATLWGSGVWANGSDWQGGGTIITGTVNLWDDPAFVDPDADDYRIGAGSAAIDKGIDAGVKTDMDFHPRPYLTPDLGADEYWPPGALKFIYLPLVMR